MTNSGKVGVAVGAGLTHLLVFVFIHDDCRRNEMAEKREKQEKWGKRKKDSGRAVDFITHFAICIK